jgi:hypothetical protein
MILCVCNDDDEGTYRIAQRSSSEHHETFGRVHRIGARRIPALRENEDLFVIAHGAKRGDDRNPVIGDKSGPLYFNAVDFYAKIESLFPEGYSGNIYFSACESADQGVDFSFAQAFKTQNQPGRPGVKHVFGQKGDVEGEIPLPGDKTAWHEA